jgi:hypothetical protein
MDDAQKSSRTPAVGEFIKVRSLDKKKAGAFELVDSLLAADVITADDATDWKKRINAGIEMIRGERTGRRSQRT